MPSKKYVSKQVEIEALRFNANKLDEAVEFCGGEYEYIKDMGDVIKVKTLEGVMTAKPGDYIIKGLEGEFYPCKASVFKKKYEESNGGFLGEKETPPVEPYHVISQREAFLQMPYRIQLDKILIEVTEEEAYLGHYGDSETGTAGVLYKDALFLNDKGTHTYNAIKAMTEEIIRLRDTVASNRGAKVIGEMMDHELRDPPVDATEPSPFYTLDQCNKDWAEQQSKSPAPFEAIKECRGGWREAIVTMHIRSVTNDSHAKWEKLLTIFDETMDALVAYNSYMLRNKPTDLELECGHPIAAAGKVNDDDQNEPVHCLWCGDIKDLKTLIHNATLVYDRVTGGRVSNVLAKPEVVIEMFQEYSNELMVDEDLKKEVKKLRKFKKYVHKRLDEAGVPYELPESEHTKAGCRIGGRLDYLFELHYDRKQQLDKLKEQWSTREEYENHISPLRETNFKLCREHDELKKELKSMAIRSEEIIGELQRKIEVLRAAAETTMEYLSRGETRWAIAFTTRLREALEATKPEAVVDDGSCVSHTSKTKVKLDHWYEVTDDGRVTRMKCVGIHPVTGDFLMGNFLEPHSYQKWFSRDLIGKEIPDPTVSVSKTTVVGVEMNDSNNKVGLQLRLPANLELRPGNYIISIDKKS